jgi:hypothetical protein
MVGAGGGSVVNFGQNTQIYLSGPDPAPQVIQEIGVFGAPAPSADAWVDGTATVDGSVGQTTVNLNIATGVVSVIPNVVTFGGFQGDLDVINNGTGQNVVNIGASTVVPFGQATVAATVAGVPMTIETVTGAEQNVVFVTGSSSVATTINGAGTGSSTVNPAAFQPPLWVVASDTATIPTAIVNGGASPVYAFSTGGIVSVDGGTAAGDLNEEAPGYFKSGSGGGAIMASNPLLATTLVGGGNNDVMFGIGNNTTMIAGAGSQTEASFATGGVMFVGNLGSGASTTTMDTFISGGNKFITGNGVDVITALGGDNTFSEGVTSTAGSLSNTATITGFNTGTDTISLAIPGGGGNYTTITSGTPTASQILVQTAGGNSTLTFGDGSKWTMVGAIVTGTNFH